MKYPQTTTTLDDKKVCFVWMKGVKFEDYSPIAQCYGIIINKNKEILLARTIGSSTWGLPGGAPEKNETTIETLKRELLEEVDVEAIKTSKLGLQKAFEIGKEDSSVYQARFVVTEYKLLKQTPDPDGEEMWERKFFPIDQVNRFLQWGKAGEAIFRDAIGVYSSGLKSITPSSKN